MSEAELLAQVLTARQMLDTTIAQLIGLSFALVVANFFFLHRAGLMLKITVFLLYALGWYVFVTSGAHTGEHLVGLYYQLNQLAEAGEASGPTYRVIGAMSSLSAQIYIVAVNVANYVLLVGAFAFLFFWKRPKEG